MKHPVSAGMVDHGTPGGWLRFFLRLPILLYRLKLGWMLGRRFLLLSHTGRKSGRTRSTVLEVVRYDDSDHGCIVASGWGKKSQWYKNVMANPEVRYTVGLRERSGEAQEVPLERAAQEFLDYADRHPAAIRKLTKLMIGEEFEGSVAQYQRLAAQVPVLRLKPSGEGVGAA